MFDNLKEKLGSFREDAEAAAEETVEEIDEEELDDVEEADATAVEAESDTAVAEDDTEPAVDEDGEAEATATEAGDDAAIGDADDTAQTEDPSAETGSATPDTEALDRDDTAPETADTAAETDAESVAPEGDDPVVDETDEPAIDEEAAVDEESVSADTESIEPADPETEGGTDDVNATGKAESEDATAEAETADAAQPEQRSSPMTGSPMTGSGRSSSAGSAAQEPPSADDEGDAEAAGDDTGLGRKAKSLVHGKFVIEEEDLEGPLHELELALLSSDVEMSVADEILDNIRDELAGETRTFTTSTGDVVEEALRDAIYDVISVGQFDFDERVAIEDNPLTIVFTGVNGVGKTTSIAKLSRYFEERGYSTVLANGDTYRAGANEQIQEHADALDTKLISHQQGGDPAAVLYDAVEYAEANDVDVVLGDTAGRLHTSNDLMAQLEKIDRVVDPDLTLFVDEAVAGQDATNRAKEFNDAAEIDGAILTKADADSQGGAAISIAHVTGKPILFLGTGQGYTDLERFDPDEIVDRLLRDEG